ncbi:layilin [Osmerus mordax]|uniref:layilin n=1 Tax=Osmerus mordax TaxID=8014 RepID=UPI00350EFAFA
MDFIRLLGTVLAVFFHPGSASQFNGQRICRRGTERPCYKISYYQDSRRRVTFEEARRACLGDGGDLLSIETENEQHLVERFIQQVKSGDGDFWIGLKGAGREPHRAAVTAPRCSSEYSWLDGSKDTFRNWHWDAPSCGEGRCVVMSHQHLALPNRGGHFLFRWNDDNCNLKNNFVCKYSEEKISAFTVEANAAHTDPPNASLRTIILSATERDETTKIGLPESSVSLSDSSLSYFLFGSIPVMLLILLLATGIYCYRRSAGRRKTETGRFPCSPSPEQWVSADLLGTCPPFQGPYASSPITKLPLEALRGGVGVVARMSHCPASPEPSQWDDYENVPSPGTECGFVTNDIYETCRGRSQTGWVENEIYG